MSGAPVVVIVPALDEARRIGRVIRALPAMVDQIVVVDDASRDGTGETAIAAADGRPITVVAHRENRGVGAAIVSGYARACQLTRDPRASLVVMAGDDQMDARDLPALVGPVAAGQADYVKGCRFAWPGAREVMPAGRFIGGYGFSLLTSWAVGQRIRDSQCGYTALARGAVDRLDLDGLWPRFGYPNDLLGLLAARNLRIVEVPVRPVYADEVSRLRARHLPAIGALILRARVRRWRAERVAGQR